MRLMSMPLYPTMIVWNGANVVLDLFHLHSRRFELVNTRASLFMSSNHVRPIVAAKAKATRGTGGRR